MRTLIGALLVVVLLAVAAPRAAEAQSLDRRPHGWLSVEGFLTTYQIEALLDETRRSVGGGGLRVMFSAVPLTGLDVGVLQRTSIGPYLIFSPTRENVRTWHFGGQLDFRLLGAPLGGLVDPHFSMGAGAMRVDTPSELAVMRANGEPTVSETFGTLAPGVGTRLHLTRGIALRTDLRDVIIFGQQTSHNWELSGGLSLLF